LEENSVPYAIGGLTSVFDPAGEAYERSDRIYRLVSGELAGSSRKGARPETKGPDVDVKYSYRGVEMRKLALPLLVLALSAPLFAKTCNSSTNRDSNGNPCTNIITKAGPATNGYPSGYTLYSQDGMLNTSTASQGLFNFSTTPGSLETLLPIDPLTTLGYNVIDPYVNPPGSLQLTSGSLTSGPIPVTTSVPLVQGQSMSVRNTGGYTKSFRYAFTGSHPDTNILLQGGKQGVFTTLKTYTATYDSSFNVYVGSAGYDTFLFTVVTLDPGATWQLQQPCISPNGPAGRAFTFIATYTFNSGAETIDPPDAAGNNTYTWSGTLSVPSIFDHCISGSGRGGGYTSTPTYASDPGTGELSATPSVQ
jgi:hypothetical protein